MTKYVFVTGGVVSGLGKGITAASLGRLLKQRGLKVAVQKLDPYMNIDPGTMSPLQHGEVFVTDDGAETDLDLGHYERFVDESLTQYSNLTSGRVYWNVLERERTGGYLGKTVQFIPHVTEEIKDFIKAGARNSGADVLITEIGGTTGDIEGQPFLEAIRQISLENEPGDCLFIHVTLVPYLQWSGEFKSKPTQHSVKELRSMGISPNIIIVRADAPVGSEIREKIALFCNVKADCVIENVTCQSQYEVPLMLNENGFDAVVCRELGITAPEPDLSEWRSMVQSIAHRRREVRIAIVGKYVQLHDSYLSICESLEHAGFELGCNINIDWVDSELVTEQTVDLILAGVDGIIVPGGFGERGIEGMICACNYARVNDIPYLGICLGMQIAVIELARNACGLADANSGEFSTTSANKVIDLMPEQYGLVGSGGTMRLGAYPCVIVEDTLMQRLYNSNLVSERHRHRFEFNNDYRDVLSAAGLKICGTSPDGSLVEATEIDSLRFFVGVQFHPEFKSRPNRPHPLFVGLVTAALQM